MWVIKAGDVAIWDLNGRGRQPRARMECGQAALRRGLTVDLAFNCY